MTLQPTFLIAALVVLSSHFLQAQHPTQYSEVKGRIHEANFQLVDPAREIVHDHPASFFTGETVTVSFRVLVKPDGSVKYVKPIPEKGVPADFRLGGAHALYRFEFAAANYEAAEDEWVDIVMQVKVDTGT